MPRASCSLDSDLDMDVDEQIWIKEHQVYCPVPWCAAHNLRGARCGDVDGDYEGLHKARIKYAEGEAARVKAELNRLKRFGTEDPEQVLCMLHLMQSSVDLGLTPGRKGRRKLAP